MLDKPSGLADDLGIVESELLDLGDLLRRQLVERHREHAFLLVASDHLGGTRTPVGGTNRWAVQASGRCTPVSSASGKPSGWAFG